MDFSRSSKCRRVLPLPVVSSKTRSLTSTFSFGRAARAASKLSAAFWDFRIYASSSGFDNSSAVNCSRDVFTLAAASSCARRTAFLDACRVCAAPICSMTRSVFPVSFLGKVPGEVSCAAVSCAACSGCLEKSVSCSRRLIRSAVSLVSFTSISPSRLIFCVILSRGFNGSFMRYHLHSFPEDALCALDFLRLCCHYTVKLGVFREAVNKRQHHIPSAAGKY